MDPARVRPVTSADLPSVARMGAELVRLHHDWDAARFFRPHGVEEGYRRYFARMLEDPETVILVAERGDPARLVGYAYASLIERDWSDLRDACGKVHDLYVVEEERGRGTGGALLEEAVRRLEALGVPRSVLMVAARNPARELFARHGFRETMIEMTRESAAPGGDGLRREG